MTCIENFATKYLVVSIIAISLLVISLTTTSFQNAVSRPKCEKILVNPMIFATPGKLVCG